jgi:serine/threonine-protein kinase HipA
MRKAEVYMMGTMAGMLSEALLPGNWRFEYLEAYSGMPVSKAMPVNRSGYDFVSFPAFFEGLLPEGHQLEGLLSLGEIDKEDYFGQLILLGEDLPGAITIREVKG